MNGSWGGSQPLMHDTIVNSDCLGTDELLQPGDVQHMVFQANDPQPHFDQKAPKFATQVQNL